MMVVKEKDGRRPKERKKRETRGGYLLLLIGLDVERRS